jgi:hypothetical protein
METLAKFSSSAEALQALDHLKSRGILATICPEETTRSIWGGENFFLVGYQLQVEPSQLTKARKCLQQKGILLLDEDEK